jgi:hypothetical protein
MASEGKTKVQFVRKYTKFDILVSELIVIPYALVGGTFFVLLFLLTFPTNNFGIFLILWLFFPILLAIVALYRNRILERVFRRISHYGYLQFASTWQIFPFFVVAISFFWGLYTFHDPRYFLLSLTFLFLCIPLYFIFDSPLTYEGRVQILFEELFSSLNNYPERQPYWKKISKIIERLLKIGNIQISSNDLIFHFNKKLLETNDDISDNLRRIQAWMLGTQRTCLDSIKNIFPEIKIEPYTKISFLRRVLENPTPIQAGLIKFFASLVCLTIILIIVLIIHPELLGDFLKLLLGFVG